MKKKLLAVMLSGSILLSLFSAPAIAAADPAPLSHRRDAVTYYATTAEEIRHICDMVMAGDNVVVAGSLTMDVPLILDNASLTIEAGSTLTLAAGILVEGDSAIQGGGMIQREAGNSGALITVADGASLLLEDVTIDGGARWSECDETDPISATLLRGTTNDGLTATAPLVLSCGDLTVKNAVLQNNENTSPGNHAEDSGTSAIFTYGSASLTLDNATVRNNTANAQYGGAVTGRSATTTITVSGGEYYGNAGNSGGFFTWGKLYLNSGTIRNNYAGADLGGGIRTATGATLHMNGGTVTRNLAERYGGGIAMYNSTGYFNGGTVSENTQKEFSHAGFAGGGGMLLFGGKAVLDGTDFLDNTAVEGGGISMNSNPVVLTMNAGNISGNTAEIGGGLRNCYGTITLNGGTITNNNAQRGGGIYVAPSSISRLIIENGEVSDNTDETDSSNIYYDAPTTSGSDDAIGFYTLSMDYQITSTTGKPLVLTNAVPYFDGKPCTTDIYGCELHHFVPRRPDFTFAYWATEDGAEFTDDTVITGDMTLYAHWYCAGEHDLTVTQVDATRTVSCTRCDYVSTTETVVVSDYTGVFDGQPHTVTLSAPADMTVTWYQDSTYTTPYSEQQSFTKVGTHILYYKAAGSDLGIEDNGTATVTITPLSLGGWGQKRVYSYDGTEKSRYSDAFSTYFDVTGTTHATEPGEYLMICTLKPEYVGNVKWSVTNDANSHLWSLDPADYSAAGTYPSGSTDTMILAWAVEGSSKLPVTLSFAEPTISKEISNFAAAEIFTNSLTGVPESGTVSYTSSKPHVAEVSADGEVTLHCVGNALITVKYAGNDLYEAASASYVIAVTSNAEENHASVDDPAVPPNCVEDGHTVGKVCRVCGKTWESTVIPATGHTPAAAVRENVVEATYHAPGSYDNVIYCSVCDTKLSSATVVIPQLTPIPDSEPSNDDSDDDYCEASVVITDPAGGSAAVTGRTVKLTPAEGYEIEKITVNGKRVAIPKDGVLTRVKSGAKVVVTFSKKEAPAPSEVYENPFVDVAEDAYYSEAVRWANETGVTTGIDATHFAPHWNVTRAQAVTFLWRAAGRPTPHGGSSVFGDVEPGSYYETAVAWAQEQKITKGTSTTTFSPNMVCTRAQIVTLLARYSGIQDVDCETNYSDVAADDYFAAAVKWADETNVTYGMGNGLFCPYVDCTRGQIVTFLWRMAK